MAKRYKTPGVYVQEMTSLPPSVSQVSTAIPAIIGYTEKAQKDNHDITLLPIRINSLLEFENYFGKAKNEENISVSIIDTINSASPENILDQNINVAMGETSPYKMYYAMKLYFANGGGPCYIVSVGNYDSDISVENLSEGLNILENYDEPTLYIFPDATSLSSVADYYFLMNNALKQAARLKDRFVILDCYANDSDSVRNNTTLGNDVSYLKFGAIYHPFLKTIFQFLYKDEAISLNHTKVDETNNSTSAIYDGKKLNVLSQETNPNYNLILYKKIKQEIEKQTVILPPSSAIAGIYNTTDINKGVWHAPANVSVAACSGITIQINNQEQESLNIDSSGKSVNAIRQFPNKGILVWGARTLAGNDNEWRYISVRRFFNMVEESTKKAAAKFSDKPNEPITWRQIRSLIENYLTILWRDGALAGSRPDDAYYVRIGLGQTMTATDITNGVMNVEIGMAVVRPAEFILLKYSINMTNLLLIHY